MKIRYRISGFIPVLLLLISSFTSSQPFGQAPDERTSNYDVQHIKIEVKLDLVKKMVEGKVTTSILSTEDKLTSFKVDAMGMNIKSVKGWALAQTDNTELAEQFEDIKYEYDKKEITIHPIGSIAKGFPYKYQVEYSVTDPEKGLYFIQPTPEFPNKRYEVWSQGEGEDNRYWFPCYDYPNDKATTEVIVTVDRKYETLSNGELVDKNENPDGSVTWHWSMKKPHSSYLVMLAVGNYDIIEGQYLDIPSYSYVPAGEKDKALKSFDFTPDVIKFFSEFTGYKYAWGRFSQIVVQDFIYGGMENTSAVVLTDGSIYDDRTPPDYTSTGLVAHELAHQWWGDVVTCKNWNEIWLNESFATYFDALYTEYKYGSDEFDYQIMRNGDGAVLADSTNRKSIYTRDGLTVNTYSKGSVVLNMLRNQLGVEKFRKALNLYITKNEFQNVTTQNLIDGVNSAMANPDFDQMPPDYYWFFKEWIYKAGQPEFKAGYVYDEDTKELALTVQQVQKMDSTSVFRTNVPVEITTAGATQVVNLNTSDEPKTFKFKLASKPLCVIFNKGNAVLSKVHFAKPKKDWLFQLKNSPAAVDRITAIRGLKDFLNDEEVLNKIYNAMANDKFWGVRNEAASILRFSKLKNAEPYLIKDYSSEKDSRIRRTILGSLGAMKINCPSCINSQQVSDWIVLQLNRELSYYAVSDGVNSLTKILSGDKLYDAVAPFINMNSQADVIRRYVLDAMEKSGDKRALEVFLQYAETGSSSRVRNNALGGLVNFIKEPRDPRVMQLINRKLSDHNRGTQNTSLSLIEKAKDPSSKPFLQAAYDKTTDDEFKKRIKNVMDKFD